MQILDFLRYVMPDVPGCPTPTAEDAVVNAAIEFLTYTGAWNEIQDPVTLSNGVNEYDLEAPSGARCIDLRAVYAAWAPTGELIPVNAEQLTSHFPNWQTAESNLPSHYTRAFDFNTIRVFPKPTAAASAAIVMHAVYTLTRTATNLPDDIVDRYHEVLASGAKARLMAMPGVTWKDLQLAVYHDGKYQAGKLAGKVTAEHGKTKGVLRTPPRIFF